MRRIISTLLALILVLSTSLSTFAADKGVFEESAVDFSLENANVSITNSPRTIGKAFYSYTQETYSYDYEFLCIGYGRVDNRDNPYTEAQLVASISESGSVQASITVGSSVGATINGVVATVQAEVSQSATMSQSWTRGETFEASVAVPPGKVGYMWVYVIGIYSSGSAVFTMLNTTTDELWYVTEPIGAAVPTTSYNFVTSIKDN